MNINLKVKILEQFQSQADFAKFVDTHESLVSKVIRGRRPLSPEEKERWADALSCDPRDIFQG